MISEGAYTVAAMPGTVLRPLLARRAVKTPGAGSDKRAAAVASSLSPAASQSIGSASRINVSLDVTPGALAQASGHSRPERDITATLTAP